MRGECLQRIEINGSPKAFSITMKYYFLFIIGLLVVNKAECQSYPADSISCTKFLDALSFFWKNDSNATNGARLFSFEKLLSCRIDSIDVNELKEKLGLPDKIKKSEESVEYIYHTYRSRNILTYISFVFRKETLLLQRIYDVDVDL